MENREEYIKYRFQRAEQTYEEAILLAENQRWNAVVNRLYYACFYAVIAALFKNNVETQAHDGVRSQFRLLFISTGKLNKSLGKLFSKLGDFRQKGDYGDLFDFDEELVKPLLEPARRFIEELKKQI